MKKNIKQKAIQLTLAVFLTAGGLFGCSPSGANSTDLGQSINAVDTLPVPQYPLSVNRPVDPQQ